MTKMSSIQANKSQRPSSYVRPTDLVYASVDPKW